MIKIPGVKSDKELLLLALCVLGTAAVAWWAWAAGPVQPKTSLAGGTPSNTAQTLTAPAYGSVIPGSPAAGTGSANGYGQTAGSAPASGNSSSLVMPPVEPPVTPPVYYPNCHPCGGAQPLVMCPYESSGTTRYPCCQYPQSPQGVCGCGYRGTELMCANPL